MVKATDISEYKVMKGIVGFYVGRSCLISYDGQTYSEPYDRTSDYFETYEEAENYLNRYIYPSEDEVSEQQEWEDYDPYC